METPSSPSGALITRPTSRRTLVKGIAWSVPAVSLAAATPAFAASPPPEVAGLLNVGRTCSQPGATNPTTTLNVNTVGDERGLWILNTPENEIAPGATVTIWLPKVVQQFSLPATFAFTNNNTGAGWTQLTETANPPLPVNAPAELTDGSHRAFTATYTGAWAQGQGTPEGNFPANYYQEATDINYISNTIVGRACDVDVFIYVLRQATVGNEQLEYFNEGNI